MTGGHSAPRPPTPEEKAFLTSPPIQKLVEAAIQTNGGSSDLVVSLLDPVLMTTQVVAGTNYKVKYHVGNGRYVHARIFEPLPCYAAEQKPEVTHFEMNRSEKDGL